MGIGNTPGGAPEEAARQRSTVMEMFAVAAAIKYGKGELQFTQAELDKIPWDRIQISVCKDAGSDVHHFNVNVGGGFKLVQQ